MLSPFSFKASLWLLVITMGRLLANVGERNLQTLLLIPMGMTILLMGRNGFPHYGIVLMPYFMLMFVLVLRTTEKPFFVVAVSVFLLAPQIGSRHIFALAGKNVAKIARLWWKGQEDIKSYYDASTELLRHIPADERDQVWNYDLRWESGDITAPAAFSVPWHSGIVQCNKITYGCNAKLLEEDRIEEQCPRWVLVSNAQFFESDVDRMSDYERIDEKNTSYGSLSLYRRKTD